jgi:hypothetical protein
MVQDWYCVHKSLSLDPVLSKFNAGPILTPQFSDLLFSRLSLNLSRVLLWGFPTTIWRAFLIWLPLFSYLISTRLRTHILKILNISTRYEHTFWRSSISVPGMNTHFEDPQYQYQVKNTHFEDPQYQYQVKNTHFEDPQYQYQVKNTHFEDPQYQYQVKNTHFEDPQYQYQVWTHILKILNISTRYELLSSSLWLCPSYVFVPLFPDANSIYSFLSVRD